MIQWTWKHFSSLTTNELYDIIRVREEVFVVEQGLSYVDCDGHDLKAWHMMGYVEGELAVYLRAFAPGDKFKEAAFGRVLVLKRFRGNGLGRELTSQGLKMIQSTFGAVPVRISAQAYLENFYQDFGFITEGSAYIEEGIPHLQMVKSLPL